MVRQLALFVAFAFSFWATSTLGAAPPLERTDDSSSPAALPDKLAAADVRAEADQDRVAASAHYAQGRILLQRQDLAGALRHYQRAWRYDPRAGSILPEIVPIAFELNRGEEAARYAVLAAEHNPQDANLVRRLAIHLTERREWARAARMYQQLLKLRGKGDPGSPVVDLESGLVSFELGRLRFLTNDFAQSAVAFARVRDALLSPDSPLSETDRKTLLGKPEDTWSLLAEALLAAKRPDEAIALFVKADEAKPNPPLLAFRQARAALAKQDHAAALQHLETYLASKSIESGSEPYGLLKQILAAQVPDPKAAQEQTLQRLAQLLAGDPGNTRLAYFLAGEYFAAQRLDEAEKLYLAAIAAEPKAEGHQRLAKIYAQRGDTEKLLAVAGSLAAKEGSLESLGTAVEEIGRDEALREKIAAVAGRLQAIPAKERAAGQLLAAAYLMLAGGKGDLAHSYFTAALEEGIPDRGEVLLNWGLALLQTDDHPRAAAVFQQMIDEKLLPDRAASTHYFLAGALEMTGRTAEALPAAKRALELDPKNPRLESRLGWVLYHAKRYDEARRAYEELLGHYDQDYQNEQTREVLRDVRLILSNIAVTQGDFAGGVERIEQVLDEYPEDPGALNDLGYLWIERGLHLQRGLSMVQQAVAAEPDNASYRDSLGWAYFQLGRYRDAVRELSLAATKSEAEGVILDHLGDALSKSGDLPKAQDAWTRAITAFQKAGEKEKLLQVQMKLSQPK